MNVLIIEDEDLAVRRLEKMILQLRPDWQLLGHLDSIETTLAWLESHPVPDLFFMDIQLADGNSFELFQQVDIQQPVIFTTAYDEFAIQAFKVNAVDYLLKPIKKAELQDAIEKLEKRQGDRPINYQALASALKDKQEPRRFLIRFGQQIKVIAPEEVAYFYTQDKITFLVNTNGQRYPVDYSLEKLEELMDQQRFFRINRQFFISIESIKEMYAYSKARVKVELMPPCELETIVSTERSPFFKKWLTGDLED